MNRIREKWSKLPRPLRAIANILSVILLVYLAWCGEGKPLSSDILEYRRLERMQMLGPGTIVHELNPHYGLEEYPADHYGEFNRTIVSETEHGIIFCSLDRYSDGQRHTIMTYQKKNGDITLAVPPTDIWDWASRNWELILPIYVFHEYPEALRAELDLTVQGMWESSYNSDFYSGTIEQPYTKTYSLKSIHRTEDFFLLRIEVPDIFEQTHKIEGYLITQPERVWETMQGAQGDAPQLLSRLLNPSVYSNVESGSAEGIIRLYDEHGNLIAEQPFHYRIGEDYANEEVQTNEN